MKVVRSFLILILTMVAENMCIAGDTLTIKLWPEGAPHKNGLENIAPTGDNSFLTGTNEAVLTVYLSEEPSGKALIMCPGGGYAGVALNHEGHDFAEFFSAQGINYAVLQYRMPNGNKEVPQEDVTEALRIMREIMPAGTKIGIGGASAGGHLAATLATCCSDQTARPDFQVLLYPVISMMPERTHKGSHDNLLGKNASTDDNRKMSHHLNVNSSTPPAFIVLSADDKSVSPHNSLDYFGALVDAGIPATLHVYPTGGHGWGSRDTGFRELWEEELKVWLKNL